MRRSPIQLVLEDSTDSLETYPPILAVPSAAEVLIGTPAVGFEEDGTYASATVDSLSGTLASAASEGADSLTLSSGVSATKGVRYLLTDATSGEVISVTASKTTSASTSFYLTEPLPRDFASGSTLQGFRITKALTTAQSANIGKGIAQWKATINGQSDIWQTAFRIVRREGGYSLAPDILTASSPYCVNRRPDNDEDFTETIDSAWRRHVLPAIYAKGLRPELISSPQLLEPAHIAACEHFLAQQFEDDPQRRNEKKVEFVEQLNAVLLASELWINPESEVTSTPDKDEVRLFTTTLVTR